uniref:Protein ROOT PRIMORDIUM DEFECTIVE 1 isoform X2 n=1 Tax=Rhizophora mucronata TaxID=61149 RepID=A0A2P2NFX2_RHIMU
MIKFIPQASKRMRIHKFSPLVTFSKSNCCCLALQGEIKDSWVPCKQSSKFMWNNQFFPQASQVISLSLLMYC